MWRAALFLAVATACTDGTDPRITITSPHDGDMAFIPGDVVLTVESHQVSGAALTVTGDSMTISNVTSSSSGNCESCTFTVTFSGTAFSPGFHTMRVIMEYDLTDLAADSVMLDFVAP